MRFARVFEVPDVDLIELELKNNDDTGTIPLRLHHQTQED